MVGKRGVKCFVGKGLRLIGWFWGFAQVLKALFGKGLSFFLEGGIAIFWLFVLILRCSAQMNLEN